MILGILALLASVPVGKAREAAMVGATKSELRQLAHAIELHRADRYVLPGDLTGLSRWFSRSPDIRICAFEPGADDQGDYIRLVAQHRGSRTRVSTYYPDNSYEEAPAAALCADAGGASAPPAGEGGGGSGAGPAEQTGPAGGPGQGRGRGPGGSGGGQGRGGGRGG